MARGIIPAGAGKSGAVEVHVPGDGDHPRGCGEKPSPSPPSAWATGSSPRVRGKVGGLVGLHLPDGIIPAGAGKRAADQFRPHRHRDHPRGCGEKLGVGEGVGVALGSSPRVRGKAPSARTRRRWNGIIPAGAGKSPRVGEDVGHDGDHPRGCGEKSTSRATAGVILGSSPRVRGKALVVVDAGHLAGIIPAGAGKRSGRPRRRSARGDHPRGCGEKSPSILRRTCAPGSSPRVRGKERRHVVVGAGEGIIPAGAGKSLRGDDGEEGVGDHPRGCGEKPANSLHTATTRGSSPRVRGKGRWRWRRGFRGGIIPAGAGKSGLVGCVAWVKQDHPRGCGEKAMRIRWRSAALGSSPRVRGKDLRRLRQGPERRIIPAGAGKRFPFRLDADRDLDHPRGCGEKARIKSWCSSGSGSSPRVRGKGMRESQVRMALGIIPAGAGKSVNPVTQTSGTTDHPRGCGEKPWTIVGRRLDLGSSPRVRGKVLSRTLSIDFFGIIPAGAGKRSARRAG